MRILFILPYSTEGASNRYRIEQYLPYLRQKNIEFNLSPFVHRKFYSILYLKGHYFRKAVYFIGALLRRFIDIVRLFRHDIVFIHREACPIGPPFFEWLVTRFNKPMIFDFDDAIFLPSTSKPNSFIEKFKNPNKISYVIKKSRYIIAGNRYLADFALRYNRSVAVIPTSIDTDRYAPAALKDKDAQVTIGWIGSITTAGFLYELEGVFSELSKKYSHIMFKIVGGNFSPKGFTNIINKPWSLDNELDDLRTFDIGIMPMPDNEWTRGKCGFKAIFYMSMGIPCVCSAVGMNKEIISDGINGFLASNDDEWIDKLSFLIEDHALRQRLGISGRRTAEEKYSININAPKFLGILEKFIDK